MERNCLICGAVFTYDKAHEKQKFCSGTCRTKYWNKHRGDNDYEAACSACGKPMIIKERQRWGARKCDECKAMTKAAAKNRPRKSKAVEKTCLRCGKPFRTIKEMLCRTCKSLDYYYKKRRGIDMAKARAAHKVVSCAYCGKSFMQSHGRQRYCSNRCVKAMARSYRRARKNGASADKGITLHALYIRDKGRCHICGKRVNYKDGKIINNIFYSGDTYPSIDHIKPLASGGSHTWDNVMLAHRKCNGIKSNNAVYESKEGQLKYAL